MTRTVSVVISVALSAAALAQRPGSTVSSQGTHAVQSAEALARTIEARVNAAASVRSGTGVVPRVRAFYDVLRSEEPNMGPAVASPSDTQQSSTLASRASLLASPGGEALAQVDAGTGVTTLDTSGAWRKVIADSGAIGWIRSSAIRRPSLAPDAGPLTSSTLSRINATILYPQDSSTAAAIRKMAAGQVSSIPNRCAGSMREALGWGLGDAHQWMGLDKRGFIKREPGEPTQPGDIVVWPFTFGSARRQHIGFAVGQEGKTVLLSNLSGSIELSQILPGYSAFAPR